MPCVQAGLPFCTCRQGCLCALRHRVCYALLAELRIDLSPTCHTGSQVPYIRAWTADKTPTGSRRSNTMVLLIMENINLIKLVNQEEPK